MVLIDKTHMFKAAVLAKKVQLKAAGKPKVQQEQEAEQKPKLKGKSAIKTKQKDKFTQEAHEICQKISLLRNFLQENRAAYMHMAEHLKGTTHITDEERDLIDRESENFFIHYTQQISKLRLDWQESKKTPQQCRLHMEGVCELLSKYLREVQNMYLRLKKQRVQYELDSYRLLKLMPNKKEIPEVPGGVSLKKFSKMHSREESEQQEEVLLTKKHATSSIADNSQLRRRLKHKHPEQHEVEESQTQQPKAKKKEKDEDENEQTVLSTNTRQMSVDEDLQKSQQETVEGLSAEEVQLFEEENEELYQEMQGVSHELESIEKSVVEIANLQEILTENVSIQHFNIERIANAVVGTTENIKDANEQIRQAIERNAGLRVWFLFFLLVMSFTLLFLDWYYD